MQSKLLLPAVLALDLIFTPLSSAHLRPDPLELAPTAPVAGAQAETLSGTVGEVVVADHVAGMTVRHVFILPHDGGAATTLTGTGVGALRRGAEASVTGRRNGDTLFVERAKATKRAPPRVDDATDRVQGRLLFLHSDDFDTGRTSYHYEVHGDDGKVTGLRLHVLPESLQPGMIVAVAGRRDTANDDLEPAQIDIYSLAASATDEDARAAVAKATVAHSVLVTLLQFADTTTEPMPASTAQQVMTTNAGSVANFFRETSFGQHTLNVTVTPWVRSATLSTPTACGSTQWSQIQQAADAAAKAAGYTATYEFHVYVFPRIASCGWAGLAYIGNPKWAYINGPTSVTTGVVGHEMGHNFGLLHAGSRDCGVAAIGGTCTVAEYGDAFNTMGQGNSMHYAASQKLLLGWIPAGSVQTHTSGSAVYTISPLELAGGTTYAVKVPVATQRTYWLEYRQPLGFDAGLTAYPHNGVQIRLAAPFESSCSGCSNDTQLLDLTPGTTSFKDGTLLAGQTFRDPAYGTTFSVLSSTATGVTVQVTSGGSVPSVTTTTTALGTSANPAVAGASVTFTATVTGSSPTGTVAFRSNGVALSGCTAVALAGSGNARTATCSTSALAAGTYSIVAAFGGSSTNAASTSNTISQSITTAPPPTTSTNVALSAAGATASASSMLSGYLASSAINNDRKGTRTAGSLWWNDATPNVYPDWLQVAFNGQKTIDRVVVYSLKDNYSAGLEPTDTETFTAYGLQDFSVQGWNGSAWVTLGAVTNNTLVKRTLTFSPFTTDRIRVQVTRALSGYVRIVEVEAWGR